MEYSIKAYIFIDFEKGMIYAYIRVSTVDQNIARQQQALADSWPNIDKIFTDKASGKDTNRPQLQAMLMILNSGDTVIIHSIDRLCRNIMDMCTITTNLQSRGVSLVFLKENLTFSTSENNALQELQLHMMSAFSQFERALIKERQAEGIAAKKARGEKTGRPAADVNKVSKVDGLTEKGIKLKLACENVGLGVSTYYKLRKQLAMNS